MQIIKKKKLKFQTVYKIDEQSVSKRQRRYGVTECTHELTRSDHLKN